MRRFSFSIVLALSILLFVSISSAQQTATTSVPNLIRYSGTLKDAQGAALSSSTAIGVTFSIYKQQDGGAPVWMETQNVTPDASGQYSVVLGSTTATGLPGDLFSQQEQRWLGVQVQGQAEQARVLLVSVPYAMKAAEADKLSGHSSSEFVTADNLQTAVQQQLQQQSATAASTKTPASGQTASMARRPLVPTDGATNFVDNTTNQVVLVTQNGSGQALKATARSGNAIYATSNAIAINAISNDTTGNSAGIRGYSAAPTGYGIFGQASSTTGVSYAVYGRASSTSGIGLRGAATATTGLTYGLLATSASPNGIGAQVWNTSATGPTFGLQGIVNSPAGTAGFLQNTSGGPLLVAATGSPTSPVTRFSVDGNGNVNLTSGTYQIFGSTVVSIGDQSDANLFLGVGAGASDVVGFGQGNVFSGYYAGSGNTWGSFNAFFGFQAGSNNTIGENNTFSGFQAGYNNTTADYNTFSGFQAGYSNTTGGDNTFSGTYAGLSNTTGLENSFFGADAGSSNTTGAYNTFVGRGAGYSNTTGYENIFSGNVAGYSNTTGSWNVFSGYQVGYHNTTGYENIFSGYQAGYSNTTGNYNVFAGTYAGGSNTTGNANLFAGTDAGQNNTTGGYNTYIGFGAGMNNTTGNYNLYLGNYGCPYPCTESHIIRIGGNLGFGPPTATFIAGIFDATSSGGLPVYINSDGQLGITTSSLRFKEQVREMGDSSSRLFQLRPVTFFYKTQYDDGSHLLQYGLIAEEVAKVYPDMVAYDKDGQPYTVKYQYLAPMLLNELQKQHSVVAAQQDVIKTQQEQIQTQRQQIADLQQRLSKLESFIANK